MPIDYTFPAPPAIPNPTDDFGYEENARVRSAKFGDGYEQTMPDGINAISGVYSPTWEPLTTAQKDTIVNFLRARGGSQPFYWTPPLGAQLKFKCQTWKVSKLAGPYWSVTVTLKQVFDV